MKRKGNGEGTVYKRKDGSFCAQQTIEGERVTAYGKTKTEAMAKLKKNIIKRVKEGRIHVEKRNITVAEWAEIFLNKKRAVRETTLGAYEVTTKRITRLFGNKKLKDIGPKLDTCTDVLKNVGYKDSTIKNTIQYLITLYNDAVDSKVISGTKLSSKGCFRWKKDLFTLPELDRVIEAINDINSPVMRSMGLFCLYTGLRRGELVGLKWSDIDFASNKLYVNREITTIPSGGQINLDSPKNGIAGQSVQIPADALDILLELKEWYSIKNIHSDYVFCGKHGPHTNPDSVSQTLHNALKKHGIKGSIHILRHLNATILAKNKVPLRTISHQLRHSSIAMTSRYINEIVGEEYDEIKELSIPGCSSIAVKSKRRK